jgi:hypothetical protein
MGTFTPELTFGSYSYGTMSESPGILYKTIQIGDQPSLNFDFTTGVLDSKITFTRASPGTYFNSSGVLTTASADTARFDYDPATFMAQGLLIEEQRTNLLTYSEQFNNAIWGKSNSTATAAAAVSPDGTTNAAKLEATATATTVFTSTPTAVAATSVTFSVYVKQGTGATTANAFLLRNSTTATNLVGVTLNYSTGVWTYTVGSTGVTITDAGNGWWRVQIAASSGITSGNNIVGYVGFTGGPQTAGDHLFAWGAQLEDGPFATSYIPTVASQVTRTADVATITGANFSQWFNAAEGSFIAEITSSGGAPVQRALTAIGASAAEQIAIGADVTRVRTGSVDIGAFYIATILTGKRAVAYASSQQAAANNGSAVSTTNAGLPSGIATFYVGSSATGSQLNGWVRSIQYYPTRLSNAQLQALTS